MVLLWGSLRWPKFRLGIGRRALVEMAMLVTKAWDPAIWWKFRLPFDHMKMFCVVLQVRDPKLRNSLSVYDFGIDLVAFSSCFRLHGLAQTSDDRLTGMFSLEIPSVWVWKNTGCLASWIIEFGWLPGCLLVGYHTSFRIRITCRATHETLLLSAFATSFLQPCMGFLDTLTIPVQVTTTLWRDPRELQIGFW